MDLWSKVQSLQSAVVKLTLAVAAQPLSVDADVPGPIVRMTRMIAEHLRAAKMPPRLVTRKILVGHRVETRVLASQAPKILMTLQAQEHHGLAKQSRQLLAAEAPLAAAVQDLAAPMTLTTAVAQVAVRTLQNHVMKRMEAGHHAATLDLVGPVQSTHMILQMPEHHGPADTSTT